MIQFLKQLIYTVFLLWFGLFLGVYIGYLIAINKAINPPAESIDQGNPKVMSDILNRIG